MIISSKPIQNVAKAYGDQNQIGKNTKVTKSPITQGKDEFILSQGAQEFGQIFNAIRSISDVRPDKVNEIYAKINAGTYQVDSNSVAEKMLGSFIG